jgi:hypothetical protein
MRRLAALMFAVASAAPLAAQGTHPDFSGKWNLDVSKLEGPMAQAGITSATLTITQDAKAMKQEQAMSSAMGSQTISVNYALDGTETANTISQGPMSLDMKSTTSWDGSVFVIKTKSEIQGNPYERTDRYTLDATGKVLTIDSSISVMGQNVAVKQTFNKA